MQFEDLAGDGELAEVGRTLARQWRRIVVITAAATLIALWYVMTATPLFTNTGSLYLGDAGNGPVPSAQGIDFLLEFQSVSDVDTQIQLIQANTLVEQAIVETGLNATVTPDGAPALPYWKWRLQYHQAIEAFAPRPGDLMAQFATIADPATGGGAYEIRFQDSTHYQIFTAPDWLHHAHPVLAGTLGLPASGGGISLLLKPITDGDQPPPGSAYRMTIIPAKSLANILLAGPLAVTDGGTLEAPTKLAKIQLVWANPYLGQIFVNQLMRDFIATQLSWKTEAASSTQNFIAGQLQKIQQSLDNANNSLAAYQARTGIVDVPQNAQAMISQLSQYEVQRATVLLQQQALQQLATLTAHPAGNLNPYLMSQANDPVLAQLAGSLATAEVTMQAQSTQFTASAPEAQLQAATVQRYQDAIRTLIANDAALATTNLSNIDNLIAQYEDKLKHMPAESLQVIGLTRASDVFGQLYVLLMQKEEEAEVSKAATIENTRIVIYAELPLRATKPNATITVLAGFLFGLLAAVSRVLAQRSLSGRFQSEDDIRRSIALPVYGVIPLRSRQDGDKSVLSARPQSAFSEGFRLLRSGLNQSGLEAGSRVIVMTSSSVGDGKTTLSANLAKILAEDDQRVLLVDGDLHRGRLHEAFGLTQRAGLTDWLATKTSPDIRVVPDQRFALLQAGKLPPNPSELLKAPRFEEILANLKPAFDYIIIDCPPLPAVADALILAQHADLFLSIVRVEHSNRRNFRAHNDMAKALACRRGMIINAASGHDYGYGYGYGYSEIPRRRRGLAGLARAIVGLLKKI